MNMEIARPVERENMYRIDKETYKASHKTAALGSRYCIKWCRYDAIECITAQMKPFILITVFGVGKAAAVGGAEDY